MPVSEKTIFRRLGTTKKHLSDHIKLQARVMDLQFRQAAAAREQPDPIAKAISYLEKAEKELSEPPDAFSKQAATVIEKAQRKLKRIRGLRVAQQNLIFDFRTHRTIPKSRKIELHPRNRMPDYEPLVAARETKILVKKYNGSVKERGKKLLPVDWWGAVLMHHLGYGNHPQNALKGGSSRDDNEVLNLYRTRCNWPKG